MGKRWAREAKEGVCLVPESELSFINDPTSSPNVTSPPFFLKKENAGLSEGETGSRILPECPAANADMQVCDSVFLLCYSHPDVSLQNLICPCFSLQN